MQGGMKLWRRSGAVGGREAASATLVTRRRVLGGLAAGGAAIAVGRRVEGQGVDSVTTALGADLANHASFGRKFSGGPGDVATAEWIAARLRGSGYAVEESTFDAPFFVQRAARLVADAVGVDVVPQAPVVPTGPSGITAPLTVVEAEVPASVRGRIAVVIAPFGRHAALFPDRGIGQTVTAAARAGAAAVVLVTTGPSGEAIALNAPETPFVPVPMAILAPKRAAPLVAMGRAGATATLTLDGEATYRPSPNLVARRRRGPRWLALSTPRSGWYDCVGERGTGTAVFLALADWAARRFPEHSIFAMNTGGHEYFFAGSHRVLHEAPDPAATDVWAHIGATLAARGAEMRAGGLVMLDTVDPGRTLMTTGSVRDAAARAFEGLAGLEEPVAVRPQAGELSAFTDLGFANAFAVLGLHSWFHTVEDTLERCDAALLAPVLRAHQRTIELVVTGA
jgi:hypothetical protein